MELKEIISVECTHCRRLLRKDSSYVIVQLNVQRTSQAFNGDRVLVINLNDPSVFCNSHCLTTFIENHF